MILRRDLGLTKGGCAQVLYELDVVPREVPSISPDDAHRSGDVVQETRRRASDGAPSVMAIA